MKKKPRISKSDASRRAVKGWRTKKARDPSRYGQIRRDKLGRRYWNRPDQQIRLKGFSQRDIDRIQPALIVTDKMLKPNVKPDLASIEKVRVGRRNHADYLTPAVIGSRQIGKPKIRVHPETFKKRSIAPSGIVAHEIGHSIFPGTPGNLSRSKYEDYKKAFDYEQKRKDYTKIEKYRKTASNPLKGAKRTRQRVDAAEDFAETYRHMAGLPVSNRSYWRNVYVDDKRMKYLYKHYLNK